MPIYGLQDVRPSLPETGAFWVAPSAELIGEISLGNEASIWFGAVLRGDNEPIAIGDRSNIQDLCVIHTDPGFPVSVGRNCTVGHRALLHGCTLGDGSLIGMGAIVLNGAIIGENCLIGAGALIPEGKTIPDRSLVVGMPAKVVRTLDDQTVEQLNRSADIYVANWRRFSLDLVPA